MSEKLLIKEIYMLEKLNKYKFVPNYYGCLFSRELNELYFMMELLDLSLSRNKNFLKKFNVFERMEFYYYLVYSLETLNREEGIVHSDIKPSNLMLSLNQDQIKIIDFGLSGYINTRIKGGTRGFFLPSVVN